MARVGLISDTHGVLDPRVHSVLAGVDAIVHAGDVCSADVLYELETIAPVTAVAGNCDHPRLPGWPLRAVARTTVAGVRILVIHDFLDLGVIPADVDVVVCGHTHRPREEWHGRVLVLNPGSASQRRSMPSRSVGVLTIGGGSSLGFALVDLDDLG